MSYKLEKKFRFESAHRLGLGYEGKCQNIHGHSWNGIVSVISSTLDSFGMGVDYKVLGEFCKKTEEWLDHKLLLQKDDLELIATCDKLGYKIEVFDDNPTSEVIAREIYKRLDTFIKVRGINAIPFKVTIKETCTTACTYPG